jgi:hypothetical protein
MNLKIVAVVAALALALGVVATTNTVQPAMARNNDKCFTRADKDGGTPFTRCDTGPKEEENLIKDVKKECKETTSNKETRCSSSQTGNGEFGNFEKNK